MEAKEELQQFFEIIQKMKDTISNLKKYSGNQHYKKQYTAVTIELNRVHKFLKAKISRAAKPALEEKFKKVDYVVSKLLADNKLDEKQAVIKELEMFWPELEIEFENLKLGIRSFDISEEVPMTECRLDIEEAIKDFDNGCFVSSLVLCRRAYEGALASLYKSKAGKEPVEDVKCRNCGATIRDKAYIGITKLHTWAITNKFITEKLKQVGFLVSDIGAGAAHPPLTEFPRDKEMARLGITATLALLKEIYTRNGVATV